MKTIQAFQQHKQQAKKISMITCYDYTSACLIAETDIDCVLVGDSSAMVMHGATSTTESSVEQLATHVKAVARGLKNKFIIGDLPFLSYRASLSETMHNVGTLIKAGAQAVKLEGGAENADTIQHIVQSGVPVMGHIGLTPQHVNTLGGYKVQGKDEDSGELLLQQAKALQAAGCFSLVIECVPALLAASISEQLTIPTIGIGAGQGTDGQVLVWQDMLGLQTELKPKFVKRYLNGAELFKQALNQYHAEVVGLSFPEEQHSY